ncbi:LuxR family transcriptional regulatory protein [Sodalis praecaptivus]|uniref:LuxR family transcriptional regulatory protein n=1 Tax=Sodalis praecaptivus TaxID=1239307 RepID=W0HW63_9GAMM|nr:PAS and helix-turn-helix domain-containing protein [Sodalis praecaptivus]AHF76767.1 LuxR family transcriptional regulatory protein [Sodalis praecaptivus]
MEAIVPSSQSLFTVESISNIPMMAIMERSHIPWGIKDTHSRIVYLNNACCDFLNVPKGFDFEGRRDDEFPCPWASLTDELQAHDRKAEASPGGAEIIAISNFGRDSILQPCYCAKFPIYNKDGKVLGNIHYNKRLQFNSISDFLNGIRPSTITLNSPVDLFTDKELEIIFYAIQKLSAKEIAPRLCLSHRTVENRLLKIYEKIGVNSVNGLIEYCHNVGLDNYVPKKLLREGVNFCW